MPMHSSTIFSLLEWLTAQLLPALPSRDVARSYAWQLLTHLLNSDRASLCARTTIQLTVREQDLLNSWVDEIVHQNKPIAYIIGWVPFLDLHITVRAPILIPRPETEWWCELLINALRSMPHEKFVLFDLCTGSGCIALAVAKKFPQCVVWGSDISREALELARENKQRNGIHNCHFIQSDLFTDFPTDTRADIITANPPYITHDEFATLDPSVKNWEDQHALIAKDNGLAIIKKIITRAPEHLHAHHHTPLVWIEIGELQKQAVLDIPLSQPFSRAHVSNDLTGRARLLRIYG